MKLTAILFSLLFLNCQSNSNQTNMSETTNREEKINPKSIHSLSIIGVDGNTINLADFKGKKILIVNTASECGYTPQYAQLEELYKVQKEKLVIIGIPTNDFGGQEPGSNEEIKNFCKKNYGVSFIMTSKLSTKGPEIGSIFNFLTSMSNCPCQVLLNYLQKALKQHLFLIFYVLKLRMEFPMLKSIGILINS